MSAFIVDTKTMDRCVAAITHKSRYGQIIRRFAGIDTADKTKRTEIGKRLFTLNVEAIQQRYPDTIDDPSNMPGPHDALRVAQSYRFTQPSLMEGLVGQIKALKCLRYQCSEGDVDTSDMYAALNEAIGELCEHVVGNLPEYERAAW